MEQHKAIIKGQILKLTYYAHDAYLFHPHSLGEKPKECWAKGRREEFVRWEEIWSGDINSPLLEVGELFYIVEFDLKVKITERIRTNSGSYIYETSHTVEVIEDDETKKSELEADKIISSMKEKAEKMHTEQPKNRTWFEKWFG